MKGKKWLAVVLLLLTFLFVGNSCSYARPPRPGPNFVWVPAHRVPSGILILGHWKYNGPPLKNRVWVCGHYAADGTWVPGHWKQLRQRPGRIWVPGHYGPRGRWIPGHWK